MSFKALKRDPAPHACSGISSPMLDCVDPLDISMVRLLN